MAREECRQCEWFIPQKGPKFWCDLYEKYVLPEDINCPEWSDKDAKAVTMKATAVNPDGTYWVDPATLLNRST